MDRFVIRAPTWKTMNYGTVVAAASSSQISGSQKKQSQTLQQKQHCGEVYTKRPQDFGERLAEIFKPTAPENLNINGNSNDSGLSSASSISPPIQVEDNVIMQQHMMQTPTKKNCLGEYLERLAGSVRHMFQNPSRKEKLVKK